MEFTGSACVTKFVTTAGTADLSADRKSTNYNPSVDFADATAGSDTYKVKLPTLKDTTASISGVLQSGGTVVEDICAAGNFGTLTIQPEGTATGKRKYTMPCYSKGMQTQFPYADTCEFSVDFEGSGAPTVTTN